MEQYEMVHDLNCKIIKYLESNGIKVSEQQTYDLLGILQRDIIGGKAVCPVCGSLLVFPKGDSAYCEDCGYPKEDYND